METIGSLIASETSRERLGGESQKLRGPWNDQERENHLEFLLDLRYDFCTLEYTRNTVVGEEQL
uniref:Uncharacterized protein n=1 Tax=Setaria italica TaxID=4555 RepID=K4AJX9_SETIT